MSVTGRPVSARTCPTSPRGPSPSPSVALFGPDRHRRRLYALGDGAIGRPRQPRPGHGRRRKERLRGGADRGPGARQSVTGAAPRVGARIAACPWARALSRATSDGCHRAPGVGHGCLQVCRYPGLHAERGNALLRSGTKWDTRLGICAVRHWHGQGVLGVCNRW